MHKTDENLVVNMQNVNKWFGEFHALKDINLSIYEGERIVVCGPSGSGKSTLIRCLNGLENIKAAPLRFMAPCSTIIPSLSKRSAKMLAWFSSSLICFLI